MIQNNTSKMKEKKPECKKISIETRDCKRTPMSLKGVSI